MKIHEIMEKCQVGLTVYDEIILFYTPSKNIYIKKETDFLPIDTCLPLTRSENSNDVVNLLKTFFFF